MITRAIGWHAGVAVKAGFRTAIETILEQALSAVLAGDQALREALDELPAAIYVTDPDG